MRTIMDQIPVTVSYIDAEFRYRYINRAQEAWLGKTDAEVTGKQVREVVGDKVWASIEPQLSAALAGDSVPLERQRSDRTGNAVWHSGRHVPDVNGNGDIAGVYTVFFVNTWRKRNGSPLIAAGSRSSTRHASSRRFACARGAISCTTSSTDW